MTQELHFLTYEVQEHGIGTARERRSHCADRKNRITKKNRHKQAMKINYI